MRSDLRSGKPELPFHHVVLGSTCPAHLPVLINSNEYRFLSLSSLASRVCSPRSRVESFQGASREAASYLHRPNAYAQFCGLLLQARIPQCINLTLCLIVLVWSDLTSSVGGAAEDDSLWNFHTSYLFSYAQATRSVEIDSSHVILQC